jgi:rhodanese-related sulfurtransferase
MRGDRTEARVEPCIGCSELYSMLEDDEVVVIDCRGEEAWGAVPEHIPGALRMSLVDLYRSAHVLPDDELIVVCGIEPDGSDSKRACRMLRLRGREAVCLEGGLPAWLDAGLPTERHDGTSLRRAGAPASH